MKAFLVPALLMLAVPTMAQEDMVIDQTKIYVSDPTACKALESKGVEAFMDSDFLALSFADGIQSMEFQCHFYDIKSRPLTPLLHVDAVCELPGELYPDTLAIAPHSENTIQVVSSYDAMMVSAGIFEPTGPTTNPGVTLYTRCDNLSEISVD
ncbi:hypothetical protein [Devosia sp. 2618]|uniref:hypothetical protein n=1 Tax=Devosia sp. 2618 TaxID=3156454 RepID=UPI00339B3104